MKYIVVCLVFGCSIMSVAARCPFPGLTANAEFRRGDTLKDEASFREAAVVEYKCPRYWKEISGIQYKITCLSNGSWSSPLPRCGDSLFWVQVKMNEYLYHQFPGLRLSGRRSHHFEPSTPSPGDCADGITTSSENSHSFQVPGYVERIEEFAIISCKSSLQICSF